MVTEWGMSEKVGPIRLAKKEVQFSVKKCLQNADQ